MVDEANQVIVATDVNGCASDVGNSIPMTEHVEANTGSAPGELLADAGYCSEDNLEAAAGLTERDGTEFYVATGRRKHDDPPPPAPRGPVPKDATGKQRIARKLATKKGRAVYARRSSSRCSGR